MPYYLINTEKTDGRYNEVHTTTCNHLPSIYNRKDLGWHANAKDAVAYAKNSGYLYADGCFYCCPEANRG